MLDRTGQDKKLQKLAVKIESNVKLSDGREILIAVPIKRGGALAVATGAMSGSVSGVIRARDRSRGDVDGSASAGDVLAEMGDGSDFVLYLTAADLRIARLLGFGVMRGSPTVLEHSAVAGIAADGRKQMVLRFHDGSVLPFQVPNATHREQLQATADTIWPSDPSDP